MNDAKPNDNIRVVEQVSAGGVVYRTTESGTEIAIVKIVPEMRWQLPKGLIDVGETPEAAALREVREEAGVDADIVEPIETIEYWYTANHRAERRRYHKFVHFFLMRYRSGDVADHDHEVAEARWASADEALRMLEFKSERDVAGKAVSMINSSPA